MKPLRFFTAAVTLLTLAIGPSSSAAQVELIIGGPAGEFLGQVATNGRLCLETNPHCVWNPRSEFGSPWGTHSIFNGRGIYGSPTGIHSVCNLTIEYVDSPSLFIISENTVVLFDVISPESLTLTGQTLYEMACL